MITLDNIDVIIGQMTGLGNIKVVIGRILSPSKYFTRCTSENDANDTVHEISTLLTSGRFHKDNINILSDAYNITMPGKNVLIIQMLYQNTNTFSH